MSGSLPIRCTHSNRPQAIALALLWPLLSAAAGCDDHPYMAEAVDVATESWAEGRSMALAPEVVERVRADFCRAASDVAVHLPGSVEQIQGRIPQVVGRYLEQQAGVAPYQSLSAELYSELGSLGLSSPLPRQFMALKIDYRGTPPDQIRVSGRLFPVHVSVLVMPGPVDLDGLNGGRVVCHGHKDVSPSLVGSPTIECAAIP